jgi:hypothetical protein
MPTIVRKKITETKNKIKGTFYLSDKSKTTFEICIKDKIWEQWGNTTDNLRRSVPLVEQMFNEKINQ